MYPSLSSLRSISAGARSMKSTTRSSANSRIGIREQSLDRGTQRRQVAGKCGHSLVVDRDGAALQPSDLGIGRRSGRIGAASRRDRDPQPARHRRIMLGRVEQQGGQHRAKEGTLA